MGFYHKPVLWREVLAYLDPQPGKIMVDCTAGGGGHSKALLERLLPGGKLVALDQDLDAVQKLREVLHGFGEENYEIVHSNFMNLRKIAEGLLLREVDGILFDLGVSSYQLDEQERGFSYQQDALLDMRMDRTKKLTAAQLVNEASPKELTRIITEYGEENWAARIASFIVDARKRAKIETTRQLAEIIKAAIPSGARREGPHPAKRTFQALRIAVNDELGILPEALTQGVQLLKPGGKMAVITFHSLEDRITKKIFQEMGRGCICPKDLPVCVCHHKPLVKNILGKPLIPTEEELNNNPRSRSAKLRVVEKTGEF